MPFTQVFGGNTIYPAQPTYLALALTADVTLEWPIEQAISGNVLAAIIDVTPNAAGRTITMPDARQGSTGYATTFYGAGADTFTVEDAAGNVVLTVASGEAWTIYLQANATLAGVWNAFEQGAGTSSATAASLAGAGIKAITTTLNQMMQTNDQGVNYALVDGDRAKAVRWTGGSGTFTLPNPATVGTDWFAAVKNLGSGSVTLSPAAGTIDGSSSLILSTGESTFIVSDGTDWYTIGLGQEINSVFDFISLNVAGTGDFTLAGAQLNRIAYEFTGLLTGNRNIIVPASVQQYWVDNSTTGAFTLTVKTAAGTGEIVNQGQRRILYCDGVNVISAETFIVSTPVSVTQGGTGLITVAQGDILYGSAADVYSLLAKSALATRYLSNTGASNNPAWAQVNLTNGVTGTLPTTSGGTGLTSFTQGDLIYSNAANSLTVLAKDVTATRYLSNTGASNNPAWAQVSLTTGVTGTLPIANGGTGQVTANAALNALLPSQTGNSGKFLVTDGTDTAWATPGSGAVSNTINFSAGDFFDFNLIQALGGVPGGPVTVTMNVPVGAKFYASTTLNYAMDLSGLPSGSTINLTNLGYIQGLGGDGGDGAQATSGQAGAGETLLNGQDGLDGGTAIFGPDAGNTLNITNASGFIWSGGGGGGGAGATVENAVGVGANGGGGGGGAGGGKQGRGGVGTDAGSNAANGTPGTRGPTGTNGTGGLGVESGAPSSGGDGGDGGDFGVAGSAGTAPTGSDFDATAGAGGAAGAAVNDNGGTVNFISGGTSPNVEGALI